MQGARIWLPNIKGFFTSLDRLYETSMYDIQSRCIPDGIDLFYFKTCIITHNNNIIEQNINVSMFDILYVKEPHKFCL